MDFTTAGCVILEICDNGVGIDPGIQHKLFDPTVTTKGPGHGTGLGLSTCKRTVEQFGGRISLRTEPGKFTEFTLDFPDKDLE